MSIHKTILIRHLHNLNPKTNFSKFSFPYFIPSKPFSHYSPFDPKPSQTPKQTIQHKPNNNHKPLSVLFREIVNVDSQKIQSCKPEIDKPFSEKKPEESRTNTALSGLFKGAVDNGLPSKGKHLSILSKNPEEIRQKKMPNSTLSVLFRKSVDGNSQKIQPFKLADHAEIDKPFSKKAEESRTNTALSGLFRGSVVNGQPSKVKHLSMKKKPEEIRQKRMTNNASSDLLRESGNSKKPDENGQQMNKPTTVLSDLFKEKGNVPRTLELVTENSDAKPLSLLGKGHFRKIRYSKNGRAERHKKRRTLSEEGAIPQRLLDEQNSQEIEHSEKADDDERDGKERSLSISLEKAEENGQQKKPSNALSDIFKEEKKEVTTRSVKPFQFAEEGSVVADKMSSDMQMFAYILCNKGYFGRTRFFPNNKFDLTVFECSEARQLLRSAAIKFGKYHQKSVGSLSSDDLIKVASFGCPSLFQKSITAAKRLRGFFKIEEHQVCQYCTLKNSCKLANTTKSTSRTTELHLNNVVRVLVTYAMDVEPQEGLVIPDEIKNSVGRLLKQIIKLGETRS